MSDRGLDIVTSIAPEGPCEVCRRPCYATTDRLGKTSHAHPCCVMFRESNRTGDCAGCKASDAANGMQADRKKAEKKRGKSKG